MEDFLDPPVYLYIKTHNKTGLKYFGRTIKDPYKYRGSGLYWVRHIESHGYDVETVVFGEYRSMKSLNEDALKFSDENDIVLSNEWANLITETGYSGVFGWEASEDFKRKISESSKLMWEDQNIREKMTVGRIKSWTPERKKTHSDRMKEVWKSEEFRSKNLSNKPPVSDTERERIRQIGLRPKSEETRRKISEAHKGKVFGEEHRKKLSDYRKGRPTKVPSGCVWDHDSRQYVLDNGFHIIKENSGKWVCLETGDRFSTLTKAVEILSNEVL